MSADAILPKQFNTQHQMPILVKVQKITQNDWINLANTKGVIGVVGNTTPVGAAANVQETWTYGPGDVNNGGVAYTATDTSIVVDGMLYGTGTNPRLAPFYILTGGGEIIEVISETYPLTAAGTFTVKRGCLGTTATATGLANNDRFSILNQIVLTSSTVGFTTLWVSPLPQDPKAKAYTATPR